MTQLDGSVNRLEGRKDLQRDLDSLDQELSRLGYNNPMQHYKPTDAHLGSCPEETSLGVLIDSS